MMSSYDANASCGGKMFPDVAANRFQHIRDDHRRVGLELVDEVVAGNARNSDSSHSLRSEAANCVKEVQLPSRRANPGIQCCSGRVLFEHDFE